MPFVRAVHPHAVRPAWTYDSGCNSVRHRGQRRRADGRPGGVAAQERSGSERQFANHPGTWWDSRSVRQSPVRDAGRIPAAGPLAAAGTAVTPATAPKGAAVLGATGSIGRTAL